jgi:spore coat polysaccharide biosynthesis protein SpsF
MKVGIGSKNENERSVAFIVARLTSSRLPKKQLRMIGDRPLLLWIIDNLRDSKELDELIIATPAEKANEPLKKFAMAERISCFWYEGHADHVTTRLRRAAETYRADICVLISGDCPLVYAPIIDCMIHKLKSNPDADVIRIDPDGSGQSPAAEGISVARNRAWRLADDLSDRPELKEHQFPIIRMHP